LPADLRRNVEATLQLNPDLKFVFFGDAECRELLEEPMASLFQKLWGPNKGDVCRTAYLLQHGGYYVDLDVQMMVPLTHLAGPETAFLTVDGGGSRDTAGLNWAILAAAPGSPVLAAALKHMVANPPEPGSPRKLWGPLSLAQGFEDVCGPFAHPSSSVDLDCDGAPTRLYYEENMKEMQMAEVEHPHHLRQGSVPILRRALLRKRMTWSGLEYGMFAELEDGTLTKLIAYPRYDNCNKWNCGAEVATEAASGTTRDTVVRSS
jgi:hypothetical protein